MSPQSKLKSTGSSFRAARRTNRWTLRSRAGCETCKNRHVKCDETRPICGHCTRLGLGCEYKTHHMQCQSRVRASSSPRRSTTPVEGNAANSTSRQPCSSSTIPLGKPAPSGLPPLQPGPQLPEQTENIRTRNETRLDSNWNSASLDFDLQPGTQFNPPADSWLLSDVFQTDGDLPGLSPLWEGYSFSPMTMEGSQDSSAPVNSLNSGSHTNAQWSSGAACLTDSLDLKLLLGYSAKKNQEVTTEYEVAPKNNDRDSDAMIYESRPLSLFHDTKTVYLLSLFQRVVQPPAAILIGGVRKWRGLQQHLVRMSSQSELVLSILLCVIELLFIHEASQTLGQGQDLGAYLKRIVSRYDAALVSFRNIVHDFQGESHCQSRETNEHHLAALFLLTWFEVIRDHNSQDPPFPSDLADAIILRDTEWNRSSSALLSWLGTLDTRATHLSSNRRLFSEQALLVLTRYPLQVLSSNAEDLEPEPEDIDLASVYASTSHDSPPQNTQGRRDDIMQAASILGRGQIKQALLNTLLQPGVEWYMCAQRFCRRIGSFDRHHRPRGTPDDEYNVIISGKQLEQKLWEIWDQRPTILSFTKDQICDILPRDVALRVHEVYAVHLACYWILFVYLHRVVWWNLPHAQTTRHALSQVWDHFQNSYGEIVIDGAKIVHPGLLWPVFLFGTETPDKVKRAWCVTQLEALGESKPDFQPPSVDNDALPLFKIRPGATKNAKRAAQLLQELVKRQDATGARVDDRDLSVEMFGCYFSLV